MVTGARPQSTRQGAALHGRARGPSGRRARRAVLVGITLLAALVAGGGAVAAADLRGNGGARVAGPVAAGAPVPLLASTGSAASGTPVDGITADPVEGVLFHIHAHLQISVNGGQRGIPGGIGILPPYTTQETAVGPFITRGAGFYWLHTHDRTGVIHVESPIRRTYTLGDFFDIWGQPLGRDQVGPAHGPVTALVDGTRFDGDPRSIPLHAHDVIQLSVGQAVPFHPYVFAPGL